MSRNSKIGMPGVNGSHQGITMDCNVERLKNQLMSSQDLSKEYPLRHLVLKFLLVPAINKERINYHQLIHLKTKVRRIKM